MKEKTEKNFAEEFTSLVKRIYEDNEYFKTEDNFISEEDMKKLNYLKKNKKMRL